MGSEFKAQNPTGGKFDKTVSVNPRPLRLAPECRALRRSKEGEPDASFGPLAVSWVKQNLDPTVKKESKPETLKAYLEGVGRGLAQALLHEFWHVTEVTQKHPYGEGNNRIEGLGNALVDLQFQPEAVKNMLAKSESTWCKFLTEGRVAIGEV